jgi:hypothetical protein
MNDLFTIAQSRSNLYDVFKLNEFMNWNRLSICIARRNLSLWMLVLAVHWLTASFAVQAADLTLSARLVWGTNKEAPKGEDLKPVSVKLKSKFVNIFKWMNYYEISNKEFTFPKHAGKKTRLSPKCEVIMEIIEDDTLQVKVFGEDQLQRTVKHPLKPLIKEGELFVVAGDDKDSYGDAWFLVIAHPDIDKEAEDKKKEKK